MGHTINLASRVEASAIGGQVLITESTFRKVQAPIKTRGTRTIDLKGVDQGVTIYDVQAVAEPIPMQLPDEVPVAQSLENPIPVIIHEMKNKEVDQKPKDGLLISFSTAWTCFVITGEIAIAQEVRLDIIDPASAKPVGVYARVAALDSGPDGPVHCARISYLPPETEHLIQRFGQ